MGFLTQLKCKKVGINRETTSRVTIRTKLSRRAVIKEERLGRVSSAEKTNTKKRLKWLRLVSKVQTVTNVDMLAKG